MTSSSPGHAVPNQVEPPADTSPPRHAAAADTPPVQTTPPGTPGKHAAEATAGTATAATGRPTPEAEPFQRQQVAKGVSLTAAILLLVLAAMSVLEGVVAVAENELYVAGVDYIYAFDVTTWGWIHIGLGAVGVLCALGLAFGTTWGRYAAVVIAALVIVANFLSLPYYPLWSVVVIGLSAVVIWAAVTWQPRV